MAKKQLKQMAAESLPSHTEVQYPLARFMEGLPEGWRMSTLPLTNNEEVHKALFAVECVTARLVDQEGKVILVRDMVIREEWEEDPKTGEIILINRLYLFDEKGIGYQTPSEPARKSFGRQVRALTQLCTPRLPPYDPPIKVLVKREQNRDATKAPWLHLVIMPDATPVS